MAEHFAKGFAKVSIVEFVYSKLVLEKEYFVDYKYNLAFASPRQKSYTYKSKNFKNF